jgi:hypothetical protein
MVHGSNSNALLNERASIPSARSASLTAWSRARTTGSYRRFQKTAVAPVSWTSCCKVVRDGPRRITNGVPAVRKLSCRDSSE